MKKTLLLIATMAVLFALSALNMTAQADTAAGGVKKVPPFLIMGKLPHLTKMLMQQWDSPELNLSADQKSKLLVVREETIGAVKRIGKEIAPLEQQVADGIFADKTPEELQPLVKQVADLKSEATMVHLRCIHETRVILSKEQLKTLMGK